MLEAVHGTPADLTGNTGVIRPWTCAFDMAETWEHCKAADPMALSATLANFATIKA